MGNCQKDRKTLQLKQKTESIWTQILYDRDKFINVNYKPTKNEAIEKIPQTTPAALVDWTELHLKWILIKKNRQGSNGQMEESKIGENSLGHSSYQHGFDLINHNDMRNQDEDDDIQK